MRLVSWNVCDRFARCFSQLKSLEPDVAVIQEVRPQNLQEAGLAERSYWIGDAGLKGMAVIAFGDWELAVSELQLLEKWVLPVVARGRDEAYQIAATWIDSRYRDCAPPTIAAIERLAPFFAAHPSIMAGDFNQGVGLDKRKRAGRQFADVVHRLGELGMRSAWHAGRCETHGSETVPTYFHTWKRDRPFHIDFAFIGEGINVDCARLGSFEEYVDSGLSDHVPIVVDLSKPS